MSVARNVRMELSQTHLQRQVQATDTVADDHDDVAGR